MFKYYQVPSRVRDWVSGQGCLEKTYEVFTGIVSGTQFLLRSQIASETQAISAFARPIRFPDFLPISGNVSPRRIVFSRWAEGSRNLTAFAELRKKVLTRNWQEHGSRLIYSIDISEHGIVYESKNPESLVTWNVFNAVFQTRRFYLVRRKEDSLSIPKRILRLENDEEEFLDLLYKKMVVERQTTVT